MSDVKQQVIRLIEALPDNVTTEDVLAEIHFKMQVDAGLLELDEDKSIAHEDVKERVAKWASQ